MDKKLRDFFLNPSSYAHATTVIKHVETHISDLFLTGLFAYKVKKSLQLDFLDFSTVEKRREYCEKELILNKKFAPDLYESVVAVFEDDGVLSFEGEGVPVEYAVKMKQFDEHSLFSELLEDGNLTNELIVQVTRSIARFHRNAELRHGCWGPSQIRDLVAENISSLSAHAPELVSRELIASLSSKIDEALSLLGHLILSRQSTFVRSLHGDLHLRNIALLSGQPIVFDGIEFNDQLSNCDVWADIAFLTMDLRYRKHPELAMNVINVYLEENDDFEGLSLLRLYESYRAQVRAKVSCLEFDAIGEPRQKHHAKESAALHSELALKCLDSGERFILAIGGFSGTGKTTLARALAPLIGAIHIRSDVVRKHLLGIELLDRADANAYTAHMEERVYDEMRRRARIAVSAGYGVIVDAVHRSADQRFQIENLAKELDCPCSRVWCSLPLEAARERVRRRSGDASDATEQVVVEQFRGDISNINWNILETHRPLGELLEQARGYCGIFK